VRCHTPLEPGADRCFVVNGGLTLVGDSDTIRLEVEPTMRLIRKSMNHGKLNYVHPDIVDIHFIGSGHTISSTGNGNDDGVTPANNSSPESQPVQVWPWILLGGGLFVFISIFFVARRRKQRRNEAAKGAYEEASGTSSDGVVAVDPHLSPLPGDGYTDSYLQEDDEPLHFANTSPVPSRTPSPVLHEPFDPFSADYDNENEFSGKRRQFI